MKVINLLPKSEQKETKLQFFASYLVSFWMWVVISVVVVLILGLAARIYLTQVHSQTLAEVEIQREVLQSSDNERVKQEVEALNTQIRSINNIRNQQIYWSEALAELGNLLPLDVHMNLISIDRASGKVDVLGIAESRDSVLTFWSNVHKSRYFKDINFPLANLNRSVDDTFSFTFYVNVDELKNSN